MRRVLVYLSIIVMVMGLAPASVAAADPEPVTWVIEGNIEGFSSTLRPWIEQWVVLPGRDGPGDEFRLEFTFDAATPDSIAAADFGEYEGAITSVSLTVGQLAGGGAVSGDIFVVNGDAIEDRDELTTAVGSSDGSCGVGALAALGNGVYLQEAGFGMFPQVDVWDSDALPVDPPPVDPRHREVRFEVCHPDFPEHDPGRIGGFLSRGSHITSWIRSVSVVAAEIDVKPSSGSSRVNPRSRGVVPVAILTTADFDATTVDPLSVQFGPTGASERHNRGHITDVDGDGDLDLLLHFKARRTGIAAGDTEVCLAGTTFDGTPIEGCDAIRTVP